MSFWAHAERSSRSLIRHHAIRYRSTRSFLVGASSSDLRVQLKASEIPGTCDLRLRTLLPSVGEVSRGAFKPSQRRLHAPANSILSSYQPAAIATASAARQLGASTKGS